MKRWIVLCALLSLCASTALAAGIKLAWDDCGGPIDKAFACNTNAGNNFIFGSFVAPAGVTRLTANEIVIDMASASPVMPAWWEFKNTGACRQTALSIGFDGTTSSSGQCADYWGGQAAGGIGAYRTDLGGNRRRIVAVCAVPPSAAGPVTADAEYFSFRLLVNNTKTVGAGSCGGCAEPVCLVLSQIKLTQPLGFGDFPLTNAAGGNFYVTWQGGGVFGGCPAATPTRNTTWGSVKALYR